jgi:hypothetical protein
VPDLATPCPCSAEPDPAAAPPSRRIGLGVLAGYVPTALIDEVLADTGRVQQRVRRLPAWVTLLFILALALFSGQGHRSVWRELTHNGADAGVTPSSSGLAQTRRVGLAPLAALFARLRGVQAAPGMARGVHGRAAAGVLGRHDVRRRGQRGEHRRIHHLPQPSGCRRVPEVRLMALMEVGTHAVIDAVFGAESEQVLAARLLTVLLPGMLLGDRNFPSWKLWGQIAATGAQLLGRAKAGLLLPGIRVFADGSWLAASLKPGTRRRVGHWVPAPLGLGYHRSRRGLLPRQPQAFDAVGLLPWTHDP